jgi:hypothetical protein
MLVHLAGTRCLTEKQGISYRILENGNGKWEIGDGKWETEMSEVNLKSLSFLFILGLDAGYFYGVNSYLK